MKKKTLTILVALSVSASALAGCGNAAKPANSSSIVNEKSTAAGTDSYTSSQEDSHSMAESSEDVEVDVKPAQGSIGESGLPYYELGFSPDDFTIDGFGVYSGMTTGQIYDAINLPEKDVFKSSGGYGWLKEQESSGQRIDILLRAPESEFFANGFVNYTIDGRGTSIYLSDMEGHTIAEADFIQSPIIPGKTTLTEAIEALGIRDLLEAMGIQGTSFESKETFEFESQFSENSYCGISWWMDDGSHGRIALFWKDESGHEFSLEMSFVNDVTNWVEIRLY